MREVIDAVERVTGRAGAVDARRRGGPAIRRCSTPRPHKAQAELHWTPRFADLESIVRTAWDWHQHASARVRDRRRIREPHPTRCDVCSATRRRIAAGSRWAVVGDDGLRRRLGRPGVRSSSRSSTTCCRISSSSALIAWAIVGLYLLKGIGSYVSSYLMADVGQRVVMDLRNALYRHILGQSAGFFAQRHDRPADVADQQRRRPGAAGGVGDGRRSRARVAGARRLRGAAVLLRRAAGDRSA